MNTCKYCGQRLKTNNSIEDLPFYCSFCDMKFTAKEVCLDRQRITVIPECLEHTAIYQTTQQFLERDTITLYHVLKEIRSMWYDLKILLEKIKKQINGDKKLSEQLNDMLQEFRLLTKKKFVVENIILERTGFLPERITELFLDQVLSQSLAASSKKMYVYIN